MVPHMLPQYRQAQLLKQEPRFIEDPEEVGCHHTATAHAPPSCGLCSVIAEAIVLFGPELVSSNNELTDDAL